MINEVINVMKCVFVCLQWWPWVPTQLAYPSHKRSRQEHSTGLLHITLFPSGKQTQTDRFVMDTLRCCSNVA